MKPPNFRKEVRKFISVINYYRNIWLRRSQTLAPLTKITTIKQTFKWTQVKQDAFNKTNRIVAGDTLLTYNNFNETFKIHTNASEFQLWADISQKDKPIFFYCRKITGSQRLYKVIDRELISIVETLNESRTILLGQKLRIYTDHKKPYL